MLSQRDTDRLKGVHPDLVKVITALADYAPMPFIVLEGMRTIERQKQLLVEHATTTLNSRHLTGAAVDLGVIQGGTVTWHWPQYQHFANYGKAAGILCGVPVEWGGDWVEFKDGTHWQLPWAEYP